VLVNVLQREELPKQVETSANILAVACPFCLTMFEDAVKTKGYEERIEVKHVIELVGQAI